MFAGNGPETARPGAQGGHGLPPGHVPNYGFVIDNRKCIGCHACSVACKAENEVPLGVNRTWVKNVEVGRYPDVRRHFQVTRCNHCANPPCVRICPTAAMYQRPDGIVEFNSDACIGCKACLQACPYDAIYIDPESRTAAKCHYCAHRTEIGLEPACVVVCPEHAIVSGDLADPHSEIARLVATQPVTVRKPEQGTAPKLFYIDGHDVAMHPTATERVPASFAFADVIPLHASAAREEDGGAHAVRGSAGGHEAPRPLPWPQAQGLPNAGPIHIGGQVAGQMVQQVTYNAQHKVPWHWPVPAYLVTKAVAAGLVMVEGLRQFLVRQWTDVDAFIGIAALLFLAITLVLLVLDLERPERFLYIFLRPQWRSWLTRGAVILTAFGVATAIWTLVAAGAALGWWPLAGEVASFAYSVLVLDIVLAFAAAAYTGWLFAQAEGRDLWQSPLLPVQLVLRALTVGSAVMWVIGMIFLAVDPQDSARHGIVDWPPPDRVLGFLQIPLYVLYLALIVDIATTLFAEHIVAPSSEVAARAAHAIHRGEFARRYWTIGIGLGFVVPLAVLEAFALSLLPHEPETYLIASLIILPCILAGLYVREHAFVMAPQEIPNS